VWWRRKTEATLDDVVEVLHGFGLILTKIDARLQKIERYRRDDEDEQEANS
jgi:hypothetical protein